MYVALYVCTFILIRAHRTWYIFTEMYVLYTKVYAVHIDMPVEQTTHEMTGRVHASTYCTCPMYRLYTIE